MNARPEIEIWFEAETRCNLACKFCFNYWKDGNSSAPKRITGEKTLEALALVFQEFTCSKMTISGGEPLLREDLLDIVRFCSCRGASVVLASNGTLLTPERIGSLTGAGVATFEISVHSVDARTHDDLSGKACWEEAIAAIFQLRAAGANVVPVFVATHRNVAHFPVVVKMLCRIGIRHFIFNRFVPTGLGLLHRDYLGVPDAPELIRCLVDADELAQACGATIHLGNPIELTPRDRERLSSVRFTSCPVTAGQKRWTLDVAGNLRRCNQSGISIGNVFSGGIELVKRELCQAEPHNTAQTRPCKILHGDLISIHTPSSLPANSIDLA